MGYDMNIQLKVTPAEKFEAVADAIDNEFGYQFDEDESWENSGKVRWNNMTEDLTGLSLKFPGVWIRIMVEGEDGSRWVEYFRDGNASLDSAPEWSPPATPEAKEYTVILLYPDTTERATWMGDAIGANPTEAIADAVRRVNEDNRTNYTSDDLFVIAVIEGNHQDVKP